MALILVELFIQGDGMFSGAISAATETAMMVAAKCLCVWEGVSLDGNDMSVDNSEILIP